MSRLSRHGFRPYSRRMGLGNLASAFILQPIPKTSIGISTSRPPSSDFRNILEPQATRQPECKSSPPLRSCTTSTNKQKQEATKSENASIQTETQSPAICERLGSQKLTDSSQKRSQTSSLLRCHSKSPASHKLISYRSTGAFITRPTKTEQRQMAAAEKFFGNTCRFLYSAEYLHQHPLNDYVPEIVVLGASNVGKSSFLNALVGKRGAARVSHRPGKTTLMNAYGIGPLPKISPNLTRKGEAPPRHSIIVMDTPGYGFKSRASWGDTILGYLEKRNTLRGAVVLLSSEKPLLTEDKWMLRSLAQYNTRTLVVITKADKGRSLWPTVCSTLAITLRQELQRLESTVSNGWREGSGWTPEVYITAAGMDNHHRGSNGSNNGGIGGVRAAILEMAGFSLQDTVAKQDDTIKYTGQVVPFDDIPWKA